MIFGWEIIGLDFNPLVHLDRPDDKGWNNPFPGAAGGYPTREGGKQGAKIDVKRHQGRASRQH